jgi:UDP-N-acetylmuramoyl-L-alanyl-D-glutamate--2,6-diaminopimelate ligase
VHFNELIRRLESLHTFSLWSGSENLEHTLLKGVTASTKEVRPHFVFAALQGTRVNGEDFIPDAVQAGADVIVSTRQAFEKYSAYFPQVAFIQTPTPALCLAKIAALFYPKAPAHIVAVTGTNGKSSTVEFARQLWDQLGYKSASMGTLGVQSQWFHGEKHLTTPDPVYLHQTLEKLADAGITHLAIEASSHGLDQYRLDGLSLNAGGMTSFSRDHLDYHRTMEAYLHAKGLLFTRLLPPTHGVAVLNADIPEYKSLKEWSKSLKIISYGRHAKDLQIHAITPLTTGQKLDIYIFGHRHHLTLPLIGEFQAYNALCALGLVLSETTLSPEKVIAGLSHLHPPAGRLEFVSRTPKGATVYVDYAHASDAIKTVLQALRKHTSHHLWIVFGAGGGRDPGTRPPMGEAAAQNADHVILTDDNPRFEDPNTIRAQLKEGAPNAHDIADRRQAIAYALQHAQKDDIILVAGKGPEDGQIVQGKTEPFLDRSVILEILGEDNKRGPNHGGR